MGVPTSIAIISGYFNPVHIGHLRLIRGAKTIAPYLVVIVNNDSQQLLKKGRIIMRQEDRLEIVAEFRSVDETLLAVDQDTTVAASLGAIREKYPEARISFCNGGDRSSSSEVPTRESELCETLAIQMHYGVGGNEKSDSSSRINEVTSL